MAYELLNKYESILHRFEEVGQTDNRPGGDVGYEALRKTESGIQTS